MLALSTLSSLLAPILLAGGVLIGVVVADTQEVYIRDLVVPPSFIQRGYSVEVTETRIRQDLLVLEREARTRPETQRLATEAETSPLGLIAEYLNVALIARALQDSTRLMEYTITGSIVIEGAEHVMRMTITHRSGQRMLVTIRRPEAEIEPLIADAASAIMRVIDPQILCTIKLREGLTATPRNLEEARSCAEALMATAARSDQVWLHNLLGIVAFMDGDQAGALDAFRAALRIDRDFPPALLNLGVLLAQNGRHEDAIRAFQAVFHGVSHRESAQTYAATYTEWGNSLVVLGRRPEALQRYADAVRADQRYAPAYFFWADALPAGGEADALRRRGALVQQGSDQLYTENLVGLVRVTRAAAPN